MANNTIWGFDVNGSALWHAAEVTEEGNSQKIWLSTGMMYLLVRHQNKKELLEFWLDKERATDTVQDGWKVVSVPTVVPHSVAELVIKELEER